MFINSGELETNETPASPYLSLNHYGTVSVVCSRVTIFLKTWKCQGIRLRSVKRTPKSGKSRG